MKKSFSFILIGIYCLFSAQIVNIPDANFKAALLKHEPRIDSNYDGQIQVSEATNFSNPLYLTGENITDLTGIGAFVKISILTCDYNQLQTLDLTNNIALTTLNCNQNELTNLDLTYNINLKELRCWNNKLTSLDLSKNTALTFIDCTENQLTNLDFKTNINLKNINCSKNQLVDIDVSKNLALNFLVCSENQLTNLDISTNTNLSALYCNQNQLVNLDVSKNTLLKHLNCSANLLTNLNVSTNPSIQFFYAQANQLESLNLKNGNNANLALMSAYNNHNLNCIEVDNVENANSYDGWQKDSITNYSLECNLSANETEKYRIQLYPNPTKDLLHFSEEVSAIKITDLSGKDVRQYNVSGKSFDVSKLPKGIYLISISTKEGKLLRKKMIKE